MHEEAFSGRHRPGFCRLDHAIVIWAGCKAQSRLQLQTCSRLRAGSHGQLQTCGPCAGCAYNQAGRSSGLTAPNGPAQSALVRKALAAAAVLPHEVAMVSVHGTGTPLGDPIEVGALGQSMAASAARPATLALGMAPLCLCVCHCPVLHEPEQLVMELLP